MLLLQEFDLEIRDKKGRENSMADPLSRLHVSSTGDISDSFPYEHLLTISSHAPWFTHIALEKFRPYILGSKIIIYTDHPALK